MFWPSSTSRAQLSAALAEKTFRDAIDVLRVPGAFEINVAAEHCAATGRYAALICLGKLAHQQPDRLNAGPAGRDIVAQVSQPTGSQPAANDGGQMAPVFQRDPAQYAM